MRQHVTWEGVFPAVTTQFKDDLSLDIDATARVMEGLIRDGVRASSSAAPWARTARSTRPRRSQ